MRATAACLICLAGVLLAQPAFAQSTAAAEATSTVPDGAARDEPWRFSIRPYFFLSGVTGSVTASPVTVPINSGFGDLLNNLRPSGMAAFAVDKGSWGGYADFQYISLAGQGSHALQAELTLKNIIAELDLTFSPPSARTLRFFAGARLYSVNETLTRPAASNQPEYKASTTVVDPILGASGNWSLGDAWSFEVRGDIGGFGVGSEFTYQMMALFHVALSDMFAIPFGYRVLGYELDTGGVSMNIIMSGLVAGLDIRL